MAKKQALGRGLGALLSDASTDITSNIGIKENLVGNIAMLKISQIEVNPFNPRIEFEKDGLAELASSIKDVDPTISITVITIAIYGNFMIAPPILGYIANVIGVQFVYLPIVLLFTLSTIIVFFNSESLKN